MKKFSLILSCVLLAVFITGCEQNDIENEAFEFKAVDKDIVESPGGQSGNQKVDKDKVESPGGQSGN